MLKIVSDPTVFPIREVDLSLAAGGLTMTPIASPTARDLTWERPDGGLNVARRARRMDFQLDLAVLEPAQVSQLRELFGMTRGGAQRVAGYLFPPFDASTLASFPFQDSLQGWRRSPDTGTLSSSVATFGRSTAAYQLNRWGLLEQVAAGVPRFCDGPLGRALHIGNGFTNLVTQAHPTAGSPLWQPGAGTPTVAWVNDRRGPYWAPGGVIRVTRPTSGACNVFPGSPAGSCSATVGREFRYSVWVEGNVRGTVTIVIGGQGSLSPTLYAQPGVWTRWDHTIIRTDPSTSFQIVVDFADDGVDRVAHIAGHMAEEHTLAAPYTWPRMQWTDVIPEAKDDVGVDVIHNTGALTFSVASVIPTRPTFGRFWSIGGGTDALTLEWNGNHLRFNTGAGNFDLTPSTAAWDAAIGRPCVVTARLAPDVDDALGWKVALSVAYTLEDGGRPLRWAGTVDGAVGDYSGSTDLTVGGFGSYELGELGLSWLRYDGRTWSDAELKVWERCILEAGFRDVFEYAQGRQFLLEDLELEPLPGTIYHRGRLTARELSVDSNLAVLV